MSTLSKKKIKIKKKQRGLTRQELEKLDKAELIDRVVQLEAYNFQLRNILQKKLNGDVDAETIDKINEQGASPVEQTASPAAATSYKLNKKRKFNFNNDYKRHVLLKLLYFGWDYQGFATQEDSNATIEHHLFGALTRSCLIESRATSNYHRCGRTDKEVSAYCQVISIDLRSKFLADKQLDAESLTQEIDYCGLLNRILPKNIQCIAWMPLRSSVYSARFDCMTRTYRYYFPKADLNIEAMREACQYLERHTDFRNFCKMDVHNGVTNYTRNLQSANIFTCPGDTEDENGYAMYFLQIKANAFLWHQIRCIMAVLLLVGQAKEEPNVINDLLDIEANPCKPQYTPAIGLPLNLFHCEFRKQSTKKLASSNSSLLQVNECQDVTTECVTQAEDDIGAWIYNVENMQKLIEQVQMEWTQFSVKCTMIRNVLHDLESLYEAEFKQPAAVRAQALLLEDGVRKKQYQKLLNRRRCESLENRIEHFVKKQRLVENENDAATDEINS